MQLPREWVRLLGGFLRLPFGGAIFSLELLYRRDFIIKSLYPAFLASITSYIVSGRRLRTRSLRSSPWDVVSFRATSRALQACAPLHLEGRVTFVVNKAARSEIHARRRASRLRGARPHGPSRTTAPSARRRSATGCCLRKVGWPVGSIASRMPSPPPSSKRRRPDRAPLRPRATLRRWTETVLLVEDDPSIREMAGLGLTNAGFRVTSCADGREGLSASGATVSFDLAVLDVMLPSLDGFEDHPRGSQGQPGPRS